MSIFALQSQVFRLAGSGASISDTSITLVAMKGIEGNAITMAQLGSKAFATIEPGSGDKEEQISFTGITQNPNGTATLTGVKSVSFYTPYTETDGLNKSHSGGVALTLSNTSGFYNALFNSINKFNITAATTANLSIATDLENGDIVDGYTLATGDTVLVKNQTTQSENGVYIVNTSGAATRAGFFNDDLSIRGAILMVAKGAANSGTIWRNTNATAITVGVTNITFDDYVKTVDNVGTGEGEIFRDKVGGTGNLKTIKAGTNITITNNADDITISSTDTGEVNTASNVGAGSGLYKQKTGSDLEFKTLVAGPGVSLADNTDDVTITFSPATAKATGAEIDTGTDDTKYVTPKAIADSKISFTDGAETLTNKTIDTGSNSLQNLGNASNLIKNGDFSLFSNGDSALPFGYVYDRSVTGIVSAQIKETSITRTGFGNSLKITTSASTNFILRNTTYPFISKTTVLTQPYTQSCWVKTSVANAIKLTDGLGNYSSFHTGSDNWELLTLTSTSYNNDIGYFASIEIAGTGDFYIAEHQLVVGKQIYNYAYNNLQNNPINAPQGFLINGKIVRTVDGSGNMTVAIKTLAGNDPSATDPVYCRIGNTIRSITSALFVNINAGFNWCNAGSSELATKEIDYFVKLSWCSNASAVRISFTRIPTTEWVWDSYTNTEKALIINDNTGIATTDEFELIGRFNATLSAGPTYTWSIPATDIIINRGKKNSYSKFFLPVFSGTTGSAGSFATDYLFATYNIQDKILTAKIKARISNKGSWGGDISISLPMSGSSMSNDNEHTATGYFCATGSNPITSSKGFPQLYFRNSITFINNVGGTILGWSSVAVNDVIDVTVSYEI